MCNSNMITLPYKLIIEKSNKTRNDVRCCLIDLLSDRHAISAAGSILQLKTPEIEPQGGKIKYLNSFPLITIKTTNLNEVVKELTVQIKRSNHQIIPGLWCSKNYLNCPGSWLNSYNIGKIRIVVSKKYFDNNLGGIFGNSYTGYKGVPVPTRLRKFSLSKFIVKFWLKINIKTYLGSLPGDDQNHRRIKNRNIQIFYSEWES